MNELIARDGVEIEKRTNGLSAFVVSAHRTGRDKEKRREIEREIHEHE